MSLAPVPTGSGGPPSSQVPFWEAFRFWLRLGFINFGGPTGQIAIMHHELVERRRWVSNDRFMHALSFCMLLPGPEAQQLATYVGWLLHRTAGGLVAGIFFVLPAFFVMLLLSWLYAVHGTIPWIAAVFFGLRAAVIAIVVVALVRIGSRALRNRVMVAMAAAAFAAIFFFKAPFPVIVVTAGVLGLLGSRRWPGVFAVTQSHHAGRPAAEPRAGRPTPEHPAVIHDDVAPPEHARPTLRRSVGVLVTALAAWWVPALLVGAWGGWSGVLWQQAVFFSKAAMVTFGGAYAVLAYVAQAAVEQFGWLRPGEMLDGLGLAETTPGPLILVNQFVGFLGAYRNPGALAPVAAGILGAAVTVWVTFAPSFLWIFLGAPFMERLRGNIPLGGALAGITAAVVGVILNLAIWFALHTIFSEVIEMAVWRAVVPVPHLASLDPLTLALAAVAFLVLQRYRWGIHYVVAASAAAGLVLRVLVIR